MVSNISRGDFLLKVIALSSLAFFKRCSIFGRPLIYFIGDSLTKGVGTSSKEFSFPYQAVGLLKNIDFEVFGYPGLSASEYYSQYIQNLIIDSKRDTIAVVFFGANDLTEFPTDQVYNDIVKIHQFLRNRGVKSIVVPVMNRVDKYAIQPDFDKRRLELNKRLRANFRSFTSGIVDVNTASEIYSSTAPNNENYFNRKDNDNLSGVHLTDRGASILGKAVAEQIMLLVPDSKAS